MSIERHLSLSHSGLDSLDAGLAWVVQQVDRDFATATMVAISVAQTMVSRGDEHGWHYQWTAAVTGLIEEEPTDGDQ